MFTAKFWKDLGERVVSSAAGGALAVLVPAEVLNLHPSWTAVGLGALSAAAVSLLKGLVASQVGNKDSASLVE